MPPAPQSSPPPRPPLDSDGLPVGSTLRPGWEVSPRQVRGAMTGPEAERPMLLDCRRQEEWDFCRVEGAVLVPMNQIEARLDELIDHPLGKDRPIVVMCHHGVRSMRVTATLRGHGFGNVRSMAGGIDLWAMDIDPTVPRY